MREPTPAARRKALGLSRMKLAGLLGVDTVTVWRYETGRQPAPPWYLLALEALENRSVTATPRTPGTRGA